MLFQRFEDPGLAQFSYAIGCPESGRVAIVDPRRDIDVYVDHAYQKGWRIELVLETHIHADYASGARELAEQTGAALVLSAHDEGETYQVAFPHRALRDGESLTLGGVRLQAWHSPGHTPEHLGYLVYNLKRRPELPTLMFSGDFLLVGSLGSPELPGEDARRALASRLYDSVRRLADLPDSLEIQPAHGAGFLGSTGIGRRAMTTLGYERQANPYLDPSLDRQAFVDRVLGYVPPFPPYYRRLKRLNCEGPPSLGGLPGGKPLTVDQLREIVDLGGLVIDLRDQLAFGAGHIPGSFGIGGGEQPFTWAAWVLPADRPIALVAADPTDLPQAVRALVRVGLDDVRGFLSGGLDSWIEAGLPLARTRQWTALELSACLAADADGLHVLDLRDHEDYARSHVPQALHVAAEQLAKQLDRLPDDGHPLALICRSGCRSTVAASLLERAGRRNLVNIAGGMEAWEQAGLPVAP